MYEKYEQLLKSHNTTNYRVAVATGMSQSTLSDWKRGRSIPKTDKLKKIADYFNVPLGFFVDEFLPKDDIEESEAQHG